MWEVVFTACVVFSFSLLWAGGNMPAFFNPFSLPTSRDQPCMGEHT
jgi:hypothetical protein